MSRSGSICATQETALTVCWARPADYVPLDYIFQTAQEYEGKRLLREQVLPGGQEGASGLAAPVTAADNMEPLAPLQVLGATSQPVLIQLIEQMPELFDELNPQSIQQLSAHPDYVLSPATAPQTARS